MTDDTVTAKLAEWEALVEGATPGPWDTDGGGTSIGHGDKWVAHVVDYQEPNEPVQARADAAFIAAAPTIAAALLGFVREVRGMHRPSGTTAHPDTDHCANDGEPWPCAIEQAARKVIGGEGRG